ncbi:MAG: hypothetical protein AAGD25_07050 [Cyanobacteria bacterium P01_F01_bin.150]
MKRKAPTHPERSKELNTPSSFFSSQKTAGFFQSSSTDSFFQPPKAHQHSKGEQATGGQGKGAIASSSVPAPYYISFTHVAPPARPDHSQPNPGPPGKSVNRAGFTHISHRPSLSIAWGRTPMPNSQGQIGIFVRSANVGFNVHTLTVAISSDYARGSCPYQVTYAHEYRHARNFLRIFRNHRSTMVQRAQGIVLPTAQTPCYIDPTQINTIQNQIADPLIRAIKDVKSQITADMVADRDSMDSPSSYAKEYSQCPRADW